MPDPPSCLINLKLVLVPEVHYCSYCGLRVNFQIRMLKSLILFFFFKIDLTSFSVSHFQAQFGMYLSIFTKKSLLKMLCCDLTDFNLKN